MRRRAVTLVELLVVLTILGILLALLLPAVQSARERARETTCKNNLHQLNLAVARYVEAQKQLPPPAQPSLVSGWTIEILPYIEQTALHESIRPGMKIADAPTVLLPAPAIMRCPVRATHDPLATSPMMSSHYVLAPVSRRESFCLFDAPLALHHPWANGWELPQAEALAAPGPHHGGKYQAQGFQQGIRFVPAPGAN